jgi:hypothetical protein
VHAWPGERTVRARWRRVRRRARRHPRAETRTESRALTWRRRRPLVDTSPQRGLRMPTSMTKPSTARGSPSPVLTTPRVTPRLSPARQGHARRSVRLRRHAQAARVPRRHQGDGHHLGGGPWRRAATHQAARRARRVLDDGGLHPRGGQPPRRVRHAVPSVAGRAAYEDSDHRPVRVSAGIAAGLCHNRRRAPRKTSTKWVEARGVADGRPESAKAVRRRRPERGEGALRARAIVEARGVEPLSESVPLELLRA